MKEHSEPRCVNLTTERLLSQSERTPPWVKVLWVLKEDGPHHGLKIQVHEVNGCHHGLKIYTSSRGRRTQPGPNLYKSKKWTDPNSSWNYASPSCRQPSGVTTTFKGVNGPDWGCKKYKGPRRGRIKLSKYLTSRRSTHQHYQCDIKRNI